MVKAGYYAVYKDVTLVSEGRRSRLSKRDWLVTDGVHLGRFDKNEALDWLPLEWATTPCWRAACSRAVIAA